MNVSEALNFDRILGYSSFDNPAQQTGIAADWFESYYNILALGDSDIVKLSQVFSDRTVAAGKISFGLRRTNLLKSNIHWYQDLRSISRTLSLVGTNNAEMFCTAIEASRQRSRISNHGLGESSGLSKAIDPSKLKRHKDWIVCSRALINYMLTILVQDGVPLSYVIRESEAPDYTLELQPNYDFEKLSINCMPLTGLTCKTDARKLRQPIHGFVHGETNETYINPKEKRQ